jgi:hypothetical protein
MNGRGGKNRIALELDQAEKPMLVMSDEKWEGRVHLGYIEPDTKDPRWDNWGLAFRAPGSSRPVAGMGMTRGARDHPEGFLTVSGKTIH